jgi:hypothetical protein
VLATALTEVSCNRYRAGVLIRMNGLSSDSGARRTAPLDVLRDAAEAEPNVKHRGDEHSGHGRQGRNPPWRIGRIWSTGKLQRDEPIVGARSLRELLSAWISLLVVSCWVSSAAADGRQVVVVSVTGGKIRFNDTPILIGSNADEGRTFVRHGLTAAQLEAQLRATCGREAESILAAYPHATDEAAQEAQRNIVRDAVHGWDAWAWATLQSKYGRSKAYLYYFDYRSPRLSAGPAHGAEIRFVFGTLGTPGGQGLQGGPEATDNELSSRMGRYWVNFAASGDPNGTGLPKWPSFSTDSQAVMFLDEHPGSGPLPNEAQLRVFDEYYASVRQKR